MSKPRSPDSLLTLSEQTGISRNTLHTRRRQGLTGDALIAPVARTGRPPATRDPELVKLAAESGLPYAVLRRRKAENWPTKLLTSPVKKGRPDELTRWQRTLNRLGWYA